MKKVAVLLLLTMLAVSAPAFAGGSVMENANSDDYLIKAPAMMLRGVYYIAQSPLELVTHTYHGTMEGKPLIGTLQGIWTGATWGFDKLARGGWDFVTSIAPNYNGAPPTHELEM